MSNSTVPAYIQALLQPEMYDHPVEEIQLLQTHISYVLLAGDFVYKFKKPVNFGFLDFSDLDKRKFFCRRELLLNRRLCPDIYLGMVEVTEQGNRFYLDKEGATVEYGVKMARMPQEGMMVNIIQAGALGEKHIDALVEVLDSFYRRAASSDEITEFGTAEKVAVNVLENFEQTAAFVDQGALSREQYDTISTYAKQVLSRNDLFETRIKAGRIRDCHGDLYSANICLADKVYIYDCIEFNDRFRYCDVASDVAFLAMDLDFHGLKALSQSFIDSFIRKTGDNGLLEVLGFYKCYRAYVRGKIGLFTAADPAVDEDVKERNLQNAAKYFQLSQQYATI